MIRFLLLVVILALAAVWVEPTVAPRERTLVLRLRTSDELIETLRLRSRTLGARMAERIRGSDTPDVGADRSPDELTDAEREGLDRLMERVAEDR